MKKTDPGQQAIPVTQLRKGIRHDIDDTLAVEEPLEIRLGYTDPRRGRLHRSVSITMRTPGHDQALALGFLYSESIVRDIADVMEVDTSRANVIRIELRDGAQFDPQRLERHFYTTSSCGVCGKASLETLSLSGYDPLDSPDAQVSARMLCTLPARLRDVQPLFAATGGNHGVALFDLAGNLDMGMEDVGRHNAMDKLIGTLLQQGRLPLKNQGILVSGRASFELLQKALGAGCSLFVAIGAPSTLAVELAQEFNIILIGFLGTERFNVYHGTEAIAFDT